MIFDLGVRDYQKVENRWSKEIAILGSNETPVGHLFPNAIHVKIVLFFTPQAPSKRLHFRSHRQKSFSFAFSLTRAHLKLSAIQKVKTEPFSLHQNFTFSILPNRAVSHFSDSFE